MDKRKGKQIKNERYMSYRQSIFDLDALFEKFYNAKVAEGRAKSTLENYRRFYRFFREYLEVSGQSRDVRRITADTIRAYTVYLMEDRVKFDGHKFKPDDVKTKGVSASTVNDYLKVLKTFFKFLNDEDLIDQNPMENIKKVKAPEKEIEILTVDELRALLNAPDQRRYAGFRDYVIMTVLIDSMVRISELLSLRVSDVDFTANTIHIRAEIAKNRKARTVPIEGRTARLIRELIREVEVFDSPNIFLANYGERLEPNHFRKRLNQYAEKAGIKKNIHPHIFRHTGATMFLEAGGDIRHLQMILGHSDMRMVQRYTHLTNQSLIEQHEKFSPLKRVYGKLNKERKILR